MTGGSPCTLLGGVSKGSIGLWGGGRLIGLPNVRWFRGVTGQGLERSPVGAVSGLEGHDQGKSQRSGTRRRTGETKA